MKSLAILSAAHLAPVGYSLWFQMVPKARRVYHTVPGETVAVFPFYSVDPSRIRSGV